MTLRNRQYVRVLIVGQTDYWLGRVTNGKRHEVKILEGPLCNNTAGKDVIMHVKRTP